MLIACLVIAAAATAATAQLDHVGQYVNECLRHPKPRPPQHFCAVLDHRLYCWGENADGQLGNGNTSRDWRPRLVDGLPPVDGVALGPRNTYAVARDEFYAWGSDQLGLMGLAAAKRTLSDALHLDGKRYPQPLRTELRRVLSVSGGALTACAVTAGRAPADNALYCWGQGHEFQTIGFAAGPNECTKEWANLIRCPRPTKMAPSGMVSVAAKLTGGCFLLPSGEIHCWDYVLYASEQPERMPEGIWRSTVSDAKAFSLGEDSICVISTAGRLSCFGYARTSYLQKSADGPGRKDMGLDHVVQVSGDWWSGCAVTAAHALYCWGDNTWSQLGVGKNWRRGKGCVFTDDKCKGRRIEACYAPQQVPLANVATVQVVGSSVVATTTDGAIHQWGAMRVGGSYVEVDTPRRLPLR